MNGVGRGFLRLRGSGRSAGRTRKRGRLSPMSRAASACDVQGLRVGFWNRPRPSGCPWPGRSLMTLEGDLAAVGDEDRANGRQGPVFFDRRAARTGCAAHKAIIPPMFPGHDPPELPSRSWVVDPVGVAVPFLGLAGSRSKEERGHREEGGSRRGLPCSSSSLFFRLGPPEPPRHHPSTHSRVAGGLLLFKIATDMVFAQLEPGDQGGSGGGAEKPDISVFPLAIPLLAGPGALAGVMILAGSGDPRPRAPCTGASPWFPSSPTSRWSRPRALPPSRPHRRQRRDPHPRNTSAALAVQYIADGAKGL